MCKDDEFLCIRQSAGRKADSEADQVTPQPPAQEAGGRGANRVL